MENILELQQVSKTFPKSDFMLDNVSFSLPYGAILGFVGENGFCRNGCHFVRPVAWLAFSILLTVGIFKKKEY